MICARGKHDVHSTTHTHRRSLPISQRMPANTPGSHSQMKKGSKGRGKQSISFRHGLGSHGSDGTGGQANNKHTIIFIA